ncbi:MAG: histidine phosphatase family protein [Deltaproteobacteria bacterium]|nr:histidine phosphatase family protein [Deltaproteobacteria bacterium]
MPRLIYFITHADVVVEPRIPVARWPLSERGRARTQAMLLQPWVAKIGAIFSSTERKAFDAASILAEHCRLPFTTVPELGENDRTSTGYLEANEFQETADRFFAHPAESVRGWERAIDAQARIVKTVVGLAESATGDTPIAVIAHGAVGALLLCHVKGIPIRRDQEQPGNNGGNYFVFRHPPAALIQSWQPID